MQTEPSPLQVEVTTKFKRNLRILAKRYRSIRADIQPVIEQLQSGELPGEQIPGVGYQIFKVRVKNRDIRKGKSAGYRLIYYVKTLEKIILVTIYSKSDQADISEAEIQSIVAEFEQQSKEKEAEEE
ncbi:MAG TPA: type II toxin-antitoxin system RelE/ParE family toxin [Leptolyngbyaceae cyanobacterium]|jgi:mRNA-degrading endonuclease RelE of RelBE toxin-antitoxin system